jgi:hypothetical protein
MWPLSSAFLRKPHKFAQSSSWFCQNHEEDCASFCGLLIKAELQNIQRFVPVCSLVDLGVNIHQVGK